MTEGGYVNYCSLKLSKLGQSESGNPISFSAIHTILTASVNRNIFPGKKKKRPDNNPLLHGAIGGGKKVFLFDLDVR